MTPHDDRLTVKTIRNVMIPMPDGVRLAANLYRPEGDGPFPGIFTFVPYPKDSDTGISWEMVSRHFASRGYAVMQVDFRGTGCSEGINPYPFDPQERADGHAVVEWMAAQPWCTGNIGICGASYGGITALSIASTRPPHLKAIIPIHATIDNYEWFLRIHGCQSLMYNEAKWAPWMAAWNLAPPLLQDAEGRWFHTWRKRLEANTPWILSWHGTPPDPDFWSRRRIPYDQIDVPTFGICGWFDLYTAPTFTVYEAVQAPKRVLIGPWKHVLPDFSPVFPIGGLHEMDRWWDRWLKEIPNGVDEEPPVTIYVMGDETWRHEAAWPIPRTEPIRLFAGAEHHLSTAAADEQSSDDYTYDSRVGTGSIDWHSGWAILPLPGDQSFDDHLSLVYTSDPLPEDVEITGTPVAHIFVSASVPETNLVVKLSVVGPDDTSIVLAQGWANPTRVDAHAPRTPLAPGEVREVTVPLHPTSRVVPAGRRLRLCLAGTDFPEIWPTPQPYVMSIHHGGEYATFVEVPIVPRASPPLPAPQLQPARTDLAARRPRGVGESHSVERDLVGRRVNYIMRSHQEDKVDTETSLVTSHHAVAETDADRPWATNLRTETTIEHLRSVGSIATRVECLVSPFTVHLNAEITIDGQSFFRKSWTKDVDEWVPPAGA